MQKSDSKLSPDHDENDHTQPINLVAARSAVPVSTAASTQPLTMRPHMEPPKPGLMTLYFRTPTPRPPGQVMAPVVGTQVSSSSHFTAKPAQDFKNSNISSWTVIRMPSSELAQAGATPAGSGGTLTPGLLPSSLGGANRHMIPTAVHPVISAGGSGPSMASIIRSAHPIPPSGHVIHQQSFSSHVPRGPAAVASISAAPKSAVATPILRTPHSSTTMALAPSSMMALHAPVRAKSPTLVNRTVTPPVAGSTAISQVVDLQKSSNLSGSSGTTHIGLGSRAMDSSVVRTGPGHSSSITIAKPINISQPIVQHLQQVYDKGNLKSALPSASSSSSGSIATHQSVLPSGFSSATESIGVVPTLSRSTVSTGYSTSIMQLSPAAVGTSLQTLRATHVNPAMHSLTSVTSSVTPHQTLTVISAKSLMPANHSLALAAPVARSATPTTTNVTPTVSSSPRALSTSNTLNSAAIPVAKVYPQSPASSRTTIESSSTDSGRAGNFTPHSNIVTSARLANPVISSASQNVLTEKQNESNSSIRFTSLTKPQVGSTYSPSPTTYLYHDQYSNLTMHPYSSNSSAPGFSSTQLRPVSFAQHSTSNTTSLSSTPSGNPVQSMSSVMVAVDSRHHVALHSPYGSKNTEMTSVSMAPISTVPTGTPATPATTSYSTLGSVNNHTSPRPSILRKRPSDSITTVVKKNLSSSLGMSEHISHRLDVNSSAHFTSVLSPKPLIEKEKLSEKHPQPSTSATLENPISIPLIPASAIKKEPGTENFCNNVDSSKSPIEASPRKKPRKQLLAANELMETHSSEGDENNFDPKVRIKEEPDEERPRCVTYYKRPNMSLLNTYRQPWKPRHNHFLRYNDVKPKEEKKPTVNELANQKGILQQANGWKIYHLSAQMEEIISVEESVYSRLSQLLAFVEKEPPTLKTRNMSNSEEERLMTKLTDLIKGNLQRSKIVQEQVAESKQQAIKVLDHKSNIAEMVNKYISRRPLKKKEKS